MGMVSTSGGRSLSALPVNSITLDAPWAWLSLGLNDMKRAPITSLAYGSTFVSVSILLTLGLWSAGLSAWIPALAGGFLILGPLLATGLYETSRRLERRLPVSIEKSVMLERSVVLQLAYMGFLLAFLYLVWVRVAMLLYALFLDGQYYPFADFTAHLLTTVNGLSLLMLGSFIGALIAFSAFAVSAVSMPMILGSHVDFATAVLTSIEAVRRNPWPMLLWAWLIAIITALGIATFFVGLAFVFPLIGHASWHAYRALVPSSD